MTFFLVGMVVGFSLATIADSRPFRMPRFRCAYCGRFLTVYEVGEHRC